MEQVKISHYSDVLCVWAYVAQVRVHELQSQFPDQVVFSFHNFSVFGDVATKMQQQWSDRGGLEAYAGHVREVAEQFDHVKLHPDVWRANAPASSMPAHLYLAAVAQLEDDDSELKGVRQAFDALLRAAFFECNLDISNNDILTDLVAEAGLPVDTVLGLLRDGKAHAVLAKGHQLAKESQVRSSPTMIFNEGRQTLAGNVGYRVLEANIKELAADPGDQQSWC